MSRILKKLNKIHFMKLFLESQNLFILIIMERHFKGHIKFRVRQNVIMKRCTNSLMFGQKYTVHVIHLKANGNHLLMKVTV